MRHLPSQQLWGLSSDSFSAELSLPRQSLAGRESVAMSQNRLTQLTTLPYMPSQQLWGLSSDSFSAELSLPRQSLAGRESVAMSQNRLTQLTTLPYRPSHCSPW